MKVLTETLTSVSLHGIRLEPIVQAMLVLINEPQNRGYFRNFFSVFTTVDGGAKLDKEQMERQQMVMNMASKSIIAMMRSWVGIIYLASSELGIKSLVQSLT